MVGLNDLFYSNVLQKILIFKYFLDKIQCLHSLSFCFIDVNNFDLIKNTDETLTTSNQPSNHNFSGFIINIRVFNTAEKI